jgi:hypothetical protein
MDLGGTPSENSGAGVQQHLHKSEDAGVVKFYAREFSRAAVDGERQALEERELNM